MNQDDMMFEYLIQMGAMQPEQIEMMRKQKQIDALRERSMDAPQGQMIGKHYVAPSVTQYAANALQGYMAGKQQKGQDEAMRGMTERQAAELRRMQEMRRRKQAGLTNITGEMDTGNYGGGL